MEPWHKSEFKGYLHDISLLTTKDKMYVVYGSGTALCRELSEDENGDISFGEESTLIKHTALDNEGNPVNGAVNYVSEGIHAYQIGDYYYLFMIQWPSGGRRQEICWRSKTLDSKGWESRKIFDSGLEFDGKMDEAGDCPGRSCRDERRKVVFIFIPGSWISRKSSGAGSGGMERWLAGVW